MWVKSLPNHKFYLLILIGNLASLKHLTPQEHLVPQEHLTPQKSSTRPEYYLKTIL